MKMGIGGSLVEALRKYQDDTNVAETVIGAIHSLATKDTNRNTLKLLGAIPAVELAMKSHMEKSDDGLFLQKGVRCIDKLNEKEPVMEQQKIHLGDL